jgi:hypothetical protein
VLIALSCISEELPMQNVDQQLQRIKSKIAAKNVQLGPRLSERQIVAFERRHRGLLPHAYHRFIREIGSSGQGPPHYGLVRLGQAPYLDGESQRNWTRLPHLAEPFPFRRTWCWEDEDYEDEEIFEAKLARIYRGNIFLGTDGCGMDWHLIVTGAERGHIWQFTDVGIFPTEPKRNFLQWYEDWLNGDTDWWK